MHLQRATAALLRRVSASLRAKQLVEPGARILVAVSGGPDSVALLSLLTALAPSWNLTLLGVHINHGLRGDESEEDARFVSALCERLGIRLVIERVDLAEAAARPKGQSLQELARDRRYAAMARVASELSADKLALGHTADDQAETLIMWMLRGSGTGGLAGIPVARGPLFIRPLLEITRAEILEYLTAEGITFRSDSSNTASLYLRNRVRHGLLPAFKRFNPGVVKVLMRQADILREEDRCLERLTAAHLTALSCTEADGRVLVDRDGLLALPLALQRRVIRAVIRRVTGMNKGPTFGAVRTVLERVVQGQTGCSITVQDALIAREYNRVRFGPARRARDGGQKTGRVGGTRPAALTVGVPSSQIWEPTGQSMRLSFGKSPAVGCGSGPNRTSHQALLDADRFTMPLLIRSWQPGDAFRPFGMGGRRKKLQDLFADLKLPREQRGRVPLLVAPEGILWVAGLRADERFAATASTTRTVIAELLDSTVGPGAGGG
ncbi:MAG: tRNA lysidine(34) synthetase TilS [Nitrospiraceae bacterium]